MYNGNKQRFIEYEKKLQSAIHQFWTTCFLIEKKTFTSITVNYNYCMRNLHTNDDNSTEKIIHKSLTFIK